MEARLTKKKAEYILHYMFNFGLWDQIKGIQKIASYHNERRVIRYRIILENSESINSMSEWNLYKSKNPYQVHLEYLALEDLNHIFNRPKKLRRLP